MVSGSTSGRFGTPWGTISSCRSSTPYERVSMVAAAWDITTVVVDRSTSVARISRCRRGRSTEHGVEGRHDGPPQRPHEVEDVRAVGAAPDPVLVLDRDHVDAGRVERGGGGRVILLARRDGCADGPRTDRSPGRRADAGATTWWCPTDPARDWVNVAMPQRCGEYVETNAGVGISGLRFSRAATMPGWRRDRPPDRRGRRRRAGRVDRWVRQAWIRPRSTWVARGPLGLCSTSNATFSPPLRLSKSRGAWRPPRWKKYSFPSSAVMKPKPRSATTFLMVPLVMSLTLSIPEPGSRRTARSRRLGRPRGASPQRAATYQPYSESALSTILSTVCGLAHEPIAIVIRPSRTPTAVGAQTHRTSGGASRQGPEDQVTDRTRSTDPPERPRRRPRCRTSPPPPPLPSRRPAPPRRSPPLSPRCRAPTCVRCARRSRVASSSRATRATTRPAASTTPTSCASRPWSCGRRALSTSRAP